MLFKTIVPESGEVLDIASSTIDVCGSSGELFAGVISSISTSSSCLQEDASIIAGSATLGLGEIWGHKLINHR